MAQNVSVKCIYCGEKFDRVHQGCYRIPRGKSFRHSHISCFEQQENKPEGAIYIEPIKEEEVKNNRLKITDYVQEVFGDEANWANIGKQITSFLNKGYTVDGIYNALYYWYNIKGNSIEKAHGTISIVDYIYNDAQKYFKELEQIKEVNIKATMEIKETNEEIVKLKYSPPKRQVKCYLGKEIGVEDIEF